MISGKWLISLQCWFLLSVLPVALYGKVVLQKREMGLENFPCSECHDTLSDGAIETPIEGNHEELALKHMKRINQCTVCHSDSNSDQLKLLNGTTISFDQSHLVCIQCHGEKGSDWRRGIHGKQVGSWKDDKIRLLCSDCHNAHDPKFKQFVADPPPVRPGKHH